jgi:hypothetical protein
MSKEAVLLQYWRELPAEYQDQVVGYTQSLSVSLCSKTKEFSPQTPLGKRLWQIRQQAIDAGLELLNEEQLEKELQELRNDNCESEASLH